MKIIIGAAEIVAGVILGIVTDGIAWSALIPLFVSGAAMIAAGIAQMLTPQPRQTTTIRMANAPRQSIYGQTRVGGVCGYLSTTNNNKDVHEVVMWASHSIQSIDQAFCDGRQIFPNHVGGSSSDYYGTCDSNTHYDPNNNSYNLKGKLYLEHSQGTPSGHVFGSLGSFDSGFTSSTSTFNGIACTYFHVNNYDSTVFPAMPPNYTVTVHGKNDIYDPRLGSYGGYGNATTNTGTIAWTNNAALCILDVLLNPDFGLGENINNINLTNFIAQANLCDQQVALAAGGYEKRYTVNGTFTWDATPGEVLEAMLAACGGRLVWSQGAWNLYVAAWYGSGAAFTQDSIVSNVKWDYRKFRELTNGVRGTYVPANYPYSVVTSSGVPVDQSIKLSGVFDGMYQPADIPAYRQDALHGYPSDANLAQDGGNPAWSDIQLRFVSSCSQAQRLAKIALLRNRQRGSGTLIMSLWAYQCQPCDVITVSFPPLNWSSKYLEVNEVQFIQPAESMAMSERKSEGSDGDINKVMDASKCIHIEMKCSETDVSVFSWTPSEELTPTDGGSPTISNMWTVNGVTGLTLVSGPGTAIVNTDGVVLPQIQVDWITPADVGVQSGGYLDVQYQLVGASTWTSYGHYAPTVTQVSIGGVINGQQYNVQINAVRSNTMSSGFVQAGPVTVSASATSIASMSGVGALASLNNVDFSTSLVINKTANNMTYSTGYSVESLRPAQALADQTAGKSLDILVDGSTYARTLLTQSSNGVIMGKQQGTNMLFNPGFELQESTANVLGDGWNGAGNTYFTVMRETGTGQQHSGNANLLIRVNPSTTFSSAQVAVMQSAPTPVSGGSYYCLGGYANWQYYPSAPPSGIIVYLVAIWLNSAKVSVGTQNLSPLTSPASWTQIQSYIQAPAGAAYVSLGCGVAVYSVSFPYTSPSGLVCDARFDDLYVIPQIGSSIMSGQGSIIPTSTYAIGYSATSSSITFSWSAGSITRPDQSTLAVPAGSLTCSSLAASTAYYFYFSTNANTGVISLVSSGTPPTSPSGSLAMAANYDTNIALAPFTVTTLASGSTGSSGGSGGGGSTCPEANELVELESGEQIKAGDVKVGDVIKGHSFTTNADVYRKVVSAYSVACASWRNVGGHIVSPREPVYFDGKWIPAHQASSTVDTRVSRKVLITVDAGEDSDHNYYLVGGTPLLIHNTKALPC